MSQYLQIIYGFFSNQCMKPWFVFNRYPYLPVQRSEMTTPPLIVCKSLKSSFNFFFFLSWLWAQWCRRDLTLTTQDIWACGLTGDSCRSIYITPPKPLLFLSSSLPYPAPTKIYFFLLLPYKKTERVSPQRAFWVIKKRARSKRLGGCGLGDREACGPFPAVFSQQKVRLVRTSVCLCVGRMKVSFAKTTYTDFSDFHITHRPFRLQQPITPFSVLVMSCWSYKT